MAEKVTVVNRSQAKSFHLSGGRVLGPGESIEVEGNDARMLLKYREVVDASKAVKKAAPPKAKAAPDLEPESAPAPKKEKK